LLLMNLRHLRYFIAVADELHITRAASRLGIKQPPLSAQIHKLEEEVGAPLFRRHSRGVTLTAAGRLFLDEARRIMDDLEQATQGAQRRAREEVGRINVGFAGATYFHPAIVSILREYRARFPGMVIDPLQMPSGMLISKMETGQVDVAFVRTFPSLKDSCIAFELLVDEDLVIALPAEHRMSACKTVPLSALAKEKFVLGPRRLNPHVYDQFLSACRCAGFRPSVESEVPDILSIIPLVAAGFGVSVVPRSVEQIRLPGVVYRPISGQGLTAAVRLAYRADKTGQAVRSFVAIARRLGCVRGARCV
jgi:DNA-binding transcriptional LysR family regulator